MKSKYTIVVGIFTVLYAFYYWGIPSIVNINKNIDFIEQKIQEKTGYTINIEQPKLKMGVTPSVWLMAENFSLLNDDNSKAIDIEHTAVELNLIPLIFGKIQIGNFSANSIESNFIYTKDGILKLGQYPIKNLPRTKMNLSKAYIKFNKYDINLKDQKLNKNISLNGNYLLLDEFKKNKNLKMSTFAQLFVNKKVSEIMLDIDIKLPINNITENQFKINGHITDIDLKDFSEYAKTLSSGKLESLSGKINMLADTSNEANHKKIFSKLSISDLGIFYKEKNRSIFCKNPITLTTTAQTTKNGININNLNILSKGIDLLIKGNLEKLDTKTPHINTEITINKSRTENFIPLLPGEENLSPTVNFLALKENYFYGDIIGKLNIVGKIDKPNITGDVIVTEGYLIKPLNAEKATIKLNFTGDKMGLDVVVPAPPSNQKVFVKGTAELYDNMNADLLITSTENVDLKSAQNVLNPLHRILKFEIGPVPIMDINGNGNINLHVTGNQRNPHAWGDFNFKNTTASFLDINNLTLTNGKGSLHFDNIDTNFITETALYKNTPITVSGKCNLKGVLDFDVAAKNQDLKELLKIVQTSPMLVDIQELLSPISNAQGNSDFSIKLTGQVTDVNDVVFNKNLFAKGNIKLYSNSVTSQGITLTNISGDIDFENTKVNLNLISNLANSHLKINGSLNDENADIKIVSNRFSLEDCIKLLNLNLPYKKEIGKIHTSFNANYKGSINKIDFNNINVIGKIYATKNDIISINNANFSLINGIFKTSHLNGKFKDSPYSISINNFNVNNNILNAIFNIQNFNLNYLNEIKKYIGLNYFGDFNGIINLKGQIKNNEIFTDINLNNLALTYLPQNVKIKILNGKLLFRNNNVFINKVNTTLSEMPLYIDGKISNIFRQPNLNLYIKTKPEQEFIDQIYNNNAVYPIKIKGNIDCTISLNGLINSLKNKIQIKIGDNSSIYYMGATIGNTPVNLDIASIIEPNEIKLNSFQYDLITTNNTPKNLLNASGKIKTLKNNDILFTNFKVKTNQPTDAKIFNILFRKPFMKEGSFTSDININGKASSPTILGKLNITDINIPLFDAIINDVDLNFKNDKIYLHSKGKILSNSINAYATLKNKLTTPYIFEEIKINLEDIDLNRITDALREYDVNSAKGQQAIANTMDFSQILIRKSEITADNIKIKNLQAKNFISHITLNEKMLFDVKDFQFTMADGIIIGNLTYNLLNNITNMTMKIKDANAQIIADTLFDIHGQVYGNITGNVNLYCNMSSQDSCTQTLGGDIDFNVLNGRMPKLGSLEYLLKAGDLVKGGITGLSIKGIVDLITPYKTGEFDTIKGNIKISDGIANNIQIYSAGKSLNMYMKGSYNLINLIADMEIFGALTKNFSTALGKIGNASLNTLFNTIPGINISESPSIITEDIKKIPNTEGNSYRIFKAVIYGDINGNDYVKSFNWLK